MVTLDRFRGRHLLLSFYRYASCPFCNLRVHDLIQHLPELAQRNLSLVAVFQSAPAGIRRYVGKQRPPFPIVADPEHQLYRQYGVESSLRGFLAGAVLHAGKAAKAMALGFLPGPMDGSKTLVPADFLIAPDGVVVSAYYGRDIADHLPLAAIFGALASHRATD
jgi:peroxiredoxin